MTINIKLVDKVTTDSARKSQSMSSKIQSFKPKT